MSAKINHHAYFEYTKPENQTSTYIGHKYLAEDPIRDVRARAKTTCIRPKMADPIVYETTSQAAYKQLYNDPEITKNPVIISSKVSGVKNYENRNLRNVPRPIKDFESIKSLEYGLKHEEKLPIMPKIHMFSTAGKSENVVKPDMPSYSKYLDLMATTNMLDYPVYSVEGIRGIAAKNNITFWNWSGQYQPVRGTHIGVPLNLPGFSQRMCQQSHAQACRRRKFEYISKVKNVPHGMKPESHKYSIPVQTIYLNMENIHDSKLYVPPKSTTKWTTEGSMIGSNECVAKYVNITSQKF